MENNKERAARFERIYAKPWVPPLMTGRTKSFLFKNGKLKKYRKGGVIVSEDDYLEDIFIVKSGLLSNAITHHALSKSFTMCGLRMPGHISGYTTFILREPAPVRITALTKTEISSVSFGQMDEFLRENPDLKDEFIRHCGRCLRSEIDAMLAMTTASTEERYWVLVASIFSTLNILPSDPEAWYPLPFKINRETMSYLLYVSVMTIDMLYAGLVKSGLMRWTQNGSELKASAIIEFLKWIEERYAHN